MSKKVDVVKSQIMLNILAVKFVYNVKNGSLAAQCVFQDAPNRSDYSSCYGEHCCDSGKRQQMSAVHLPSNYACA